MLYFDDWEIVFVIVYCLEVLVEDYIEVFVESLGEVLEEEYNVLVEEMVFDEYVLFNELEDFWGFIFVCYQLDVVVDVWLEDVGEIFDLVIFFDCFLLQGEGVCMFINVNWQIMVGGVVFIFDDMLFISEDDDEGRCCINIYEKDEFVFDNGNC